jgi:hypothetical protein
VTVWDELAPIAIAMHTLTTADVAAFATLCELEATRRTASAEKNREDFRPFLVTTPDPDGNTHTKVTEHPAIRLERTTASALGPLREVRPRACRPGAYQPAEGRAEAEQMGGNHTDLRMATASPFEARGATWSAGWPVKLFNRNAGGDRRGPTSRASVQKL